MLKIPAISTYNVLHNGLVEALTFGFLPLFLIFIAAFASALVFSRHPFHAFIAAGFAVVGCYLGMSIGGSRESITGAVLPAIITLLSGFIAYYFKAEAGVFNRRIVPGCILALVVGCSFGQAFYGELRATSENYKVSVDIATESEKAKIRASEQFAKTVTDRVNLYIVCKNQIPDQVDMCKQAFLNLPK